INIAIHYDPEASVYYAVGKNVKGLVVEAETLDELKKEIDLVLPELLNANHHPDRRNLRTNFSFDPAIA
ncbi:DUF1902 domain-containing protein, partial [Acinetobacter baumannii]